MVMVTAWTKRMVEMVGERGNNAKNSDLYIRGRWLNTFN